MQTTGLRALSPLPASRSPGRSGPPVQPPAGPEDRAELSGGTPPPPPPRGWGRKLLGWTGKAALGLTVGAVGLGAVGYLGNRDVLHEAPQVNIYLERDLFDSPTRPQPAPTLVEQVRQGAAPRTLTILETPAAAPALQGVSVRVPQATLDRLVRDAQQSPAAQKLLAEQSRQLTRQLEEQLGKLKVQDRQLLLDLEMPLPTGQQSFLHVGSVNLPSLGYRALAREPLPLALTYSVDSLQSHFGVEVTAVPVTQAQLPEGATQGVLVGGLRVRLQAPETALQLQGRVELDHDLGGSATRAQLTSVQAKLTQVQPGTARHAELTQLAQKLQTRLATGQRLGQALSQQELNGLLNDAMQEQQVQFQMDLQHPAGTVLEVDYQVWVVPDRDGDGQAEVALRAQPRLDGLSQLQVNLPRADSQGQGPNGWLGGRINREVRTRLLDGLHQAAGQATAQLQGQAGQLAQQALQQRTPELERMIAAELKSLQREVPATPFSVPMTVNLQGLALDGQAVTLSLAQGPAMTGQTVPDGQVATRFNGRLLNQQLRDVKDGGAVRWEPLLKQVGKAADLRRLELGKDSAGQTLYPQLISHQGGPAIRLPLVMQNTAIGPVIRCNVTVPVRLEASQGAIQIKPRLDAMVWQSTAPPDTVLDPIQWLPASFFNRLVSTIVSQATGGASHLEFRVAEVEFTRAELLMTQGQSAPDVMLQGVPHVKPGK